MPLNKQIVPVTLNGIDTKTDPKQVVPGKLLQLQNGIFKTAKEIRKRNGFDNIPNAIQGGGSLSAGVNAAGYMNELTLLDGNNLYSYSNATSNLFNKGPLPTTSIAQQSIVRNLYQQTSPDSAINGNYQVFAWRDSSNSGNVRYSVIDRTTGQSIVANQQVTFFNSTVKVLAISHYVLIIYYDSVGLTNLYYKYVDINNPTVLSSQQTIATDLDGTYVLFDASVINGSIYVAYATPSATALYFINSSLILSSQLKVTGDEPTKSINVFGDASGNVWVGYSNNSDSCAFIVNGTLTSVLVTKKILVPGNPSLNITGIVTGTTGTYYFEVGGNSYSTTLGTGYSNAIVQNTLTLSGTVGTSSQVVTGVGLASKALNYLGTYYFLVVFPTQEQSTYFLLNQTGLVVAKLSPTLSGPNSNRILPEVNILASGSYQFTTLTRDLLVAFDQVPNALSGFNNYTAFGVNSYQVNFVLTAKPKLVAGQNLHYGGGILWMYDGIKPVEHSYNIFPEGVLASATTTGGGLGIGASTSTVNQWQYSAIYEWMDNEGQLHKSATSIPVTVQAPTTTPISFTGSTIINTTSINSVSSFTGLVVGQVISNANFPSGTYITGLLPTFNQIIVSKPATATASGQTFTTKDVGSNLVTVPTLRLTQKTGVIIVIYRTVINGTVFYRVTDPKNPLYNDPTVNSVSFTDTVADATILGNEQIYTTGGEVDNIAAPAVSALAIYRNRAVYLTPESPLSWGYSKQVIPGSPVEFNSELFTQAIDPKGGPLTALAEMDDKIILFKYGFMFYVVGEGPTPSGLNNDYQDPQVISTDTGCNNQNSIVLTPIGLMFQSPKGIYLLNRALQVSYIGAEVEGFNSATVTSAILVNSLNQVRFTLNTGVCLVYDYYFQQWSVFTNINAADSTQFQNQHTYISPSGVISQEDMNVFTDNGAFIPLFMQTSWFSFAGLQGFERFYKMLLLGDYKSPHTLNITVAFDFNSSSTSIDPIPVLTNPGVYQYRIFMPQQKCEAFQLTIGDSQTSPFGEGFSISAITLEVGLKQGLFKMPSSSSYG